MRITDYGEDYKYQGPRFRKLGPESGEEFREEHLIPWLKENAGEEELVFDFAGTEVFTPSFMEECFGGAIRKGYKELKKKARFENMPDHERERLKKYVEQAKPLKPNK